MFPFLFVYSVSAAPIDANNIGSLGIFSTNGNTSTTHRNHKTAVNNSLGKIGLLAYILGFSFAIILVILLISLKLVPKRVLKYHVLVFGLLSAIGSGAHVLICELERLPALSVQKM
jgi:hypothetical protein